MVRGLPRQAESLRGDALLEILKCFGAGSPNILDRQGAALLADGYLFALRRSELVGLDLQDQVIGDEKSWGVLRLRRKTIAVVLARSKTAKGIAEIISVSRKNNSQAVKAIEGWIFEAGIRTRQPCSGASLGAVA